MDLADLNTHNTNTTNSTNTTNTNTTNSSNANINTRECVYSNLTQLLDIMLKRGLSGFLSLDATLFVWDQCFITGMCACMYIYIMGCVCIVP